MAGQAFRITRLTPHLGAEIEGIDLAQPLAPDQEAALRAALFAHGVLGFRDQQLTPARQLELAAVFGTPLAEPHPKFGHVAGMPALSEIVNDADNPPDINVWHTDLTFRAQCATACLLYCRELPEIGGDTLWSSSAAAFDSLSPALQAFLERMSALHRIPVEGYPIERIATLADREHEAVHPVVRVHGVSGRRCLFVNRVYTREIIGLTRRESRHVLELLFEAAESADVQMRYRWRRDSLVVWDNTQTQHFAVADYFPARRVMRRVAVSLDGA